jgi:hypothetical protein
VKPLRLIAIAKIGKKTERVRERGCELGTAGPRPYAL